jgi:hypothetical protein
MGMTRKHFKELAIILNVFNKEVEALKFIEAEDKKDILEKENCLKSLIENKLINEIANFCRNENPNFDYNRFHNAIDEKLI